MTTHLHAHITGDKLRVWWQFEPPAGGTDPVQCFENKAPLTGFGDGSTNLEYRNYWPTTHYVASISISYANGYEAEFSTTEI